jgi:hypothetical protein
MTVASSWSGWTQRQSCVLALGAALLLLPCAFLAGKSYGLRAAASIAGGATTAEMQLSSRSLKILTQPLGFYVANHASVFYSLARAAGTDKVTSHR